MIITRNWLNEWINLSSVSTDELCKTLNKIGLEVASVTSYSMPKNCVAGVVKAKSQHPNAEKLSICMVDIGEKEPVQIVCGAKNVEAGQLVPVALAGCILPNGLKIKETELRGVKSCGMICSSTELGYPKTNDGIMVIDSALLSLSPGAPLHEVPEFKDDAIEIELTPNRGDCLSIYGIARDLGAVYNTKVNLPAKEAAEDLSQTGIGRILDLNINGAIDSSLVYKAVLIKELKPCVIMDLYLGMAEIKTDTVLEKYLAYATHSTGVVLRAYRTDAFQKNENDKLTVTIKKDDNSLDAVWGKERLSYIGISQENFSKPNDNDELIILEASFANPAQIASNGARNIKNSDEILFRSLRGSEPNLNFGINYLTLFLSKISKVGILTGTQHTAEKKLLRQISVNFDDIYSIIGVEIPKNEIITILKNLCFNSVFKAEQNVMVIDIPPFRHDIENIHDICEEIVRIVGIDNIEAKPLIFTEANRTNRVYKDFEKRKFYRYKAIAAGFFESVHYIFTQRTKQELYGFECVEEKLDILNPITVELDTLRTTCALNLTEAVSNNIKAGRKSVCLFELGKVFDAKRNEKVVMTFIASGQSEKPSMINRGKPNEFNFALFAQKMALILGGFQIKKALPNSKFYSPYEYGEIIINGKTTGFIARIAAEKEYDLMRTYICEVDFDMLPFERKRAKVYSKLPSVSRDLSILVPKNLPYAEISECLKLHAPKELKEFYPIDIYTDDSLGDNESLTLTLVFIPEEKTFVETEINGFVEQILNALLSKLKVKMR
ncbi:MAG: phenylalanine--tRNA ligase subunit beta [Campylobacteraceae bacterium]|jgi:phenylalanyl-tRNA synthetase beta chain|nr:phenylalanine--tRNA ligase subunit beta [Campylobacteraceae bacterium]